MSYANCIMYGAVIPSYNGDEKCETIGADEKVNCDDPKQAERILRTFEQYND